MPHDIRNPIGLLVHGLEHAGKFLVVGMVGGEHLKPSADGRQGIVDLVRNAQRQIVYGVVALLFGLERGTRRSDIDHRTLPVRPVQRHDQLGRFDRSQ